MEAWGGPIAQEAFIEVIPDDDDNEPVWSKGGVREIGFDGVLSQ
jgi:hypothetical protein